jgi:hypothetical protein
MNQLYRLILIAILVQGTLQAQYPMNISRIQPIKDLSFSKISSALETNSNLYSIATQNWENYPYAPDVKFRMAHDASTIYLKFYVTEDHILAQRTETNSSTHRDSCVEFFIDPDQSGAYYNFEFNCIGTIHLAYGPDRREREFIDPELIEKSIFIESTLGNEPFEEQSGSFTWEMTVALPAEVFTHTQNLSFSGLKSRANFYKCADDTQKPHFLTWAKVGTERPDFHRPDFFEFVQFE